MVKEDKTQANMVHLLLYLLHFVEWHLCQSDFLSLYIIPLWMQNECCFYNMIPILWSLHGIDVWVTMVNWNAQVVNLFKLIINIFNTLCFVHFVLIIYFYDCKLFKNVECPMYKLTR